MWNTLVESKFLQMLKEKILWMQKYKKIKMIIIFWKLLCVSHYYKNFTCVYHILDELIVKTVWALAIINSARL